MAGEEIIIDVGPPELGIELAVPRDLWEGLQLHEQDALVNEAVTSYYEGLPRPGFGDKMRQFGSGASDRVVGTAEDIGLAIPRAGRWMGNQVDAGLRQLGLDIPQQPGAMEAYPDTWVRKMHGLGVTDPQDPRIPEFYRAGQFVGDAATAIVPLGAWGTSASITARGGKALGPLENLAKNMAWTVRSPAAAAGSIVAEGLLDYQGNRVGGEFGEAVGQKLGYPEIGRGVGEVLGEIAVPTSVDVGRNLAAAGVQRAYGNLPSSPGHTPGAEVSVPSSELYRIARENNIPATPGLIGNPQAQTTEMLAAAVPGMGSGVIRRQEAQVSALADAVANSANNMRGNTRGLATGESGGLGITISEAAENADKALRARLSLLTEQEFDALGGPKQGVLVDRIRAEAEDVGRRLSAGNADIIRGRMDDLARDRVTPKDVPLDTQLRAMRDTAQAQLDRIAAALADPKLPKSQARTLKGQAGSLRKYVGRLDKQIDANLGVRVDRLDDYRATLGREVGKDRPRIPKNAEAPLYRGIREDQRLHAADRGTEDALIAAVDEKARLLNEDLPLSEGGDVPFVRSILDSKNRPHLIYQKFFGSRSAGSTPQLEALKRNVSPEEWDNIRGDFLTVMVRPTSSNQLTSSTAGEMFSPTKFVTEWNNLPDASKALLFDRGTVERLDGLAALAKQITQRRAGPGAQNARIGTAAGAAIGVLTQPGKTLAMLGTAGAASSAFLSDAFTRIVAGESPKLADRMLGRAIRQAAEEPARDRAEDPYVEGVSNLLKGAR